MQTIGPNEDGKRAVATPDGRSRKKKTPGKILCVMTEHLLVKVLKCVYIESSSQSLMEYCIYFCIKIDMYTSTTYNYTHTRTYNKTV